MVNITNEESKKALKKYSPSEKREIYKVFEKLHRLIEEQERYGIPFEKIFNNETIKYDDLGEMFYTFKSQGKDKSQIRLLYRFKRINDEEFELELHKVHIKRRNTKEYMKEFEAYVEEYIN